MQIKKITHALALIVGMLAGGLAHAGDYGSVYLQTSLISQTIGYGLSVSDNWAVRLHYSASKTWSADSTDTGDFGSSAQMHADFQFKSTSLLADWYPGSGGFRLTPGIVFNDSKLNLSGTGTVGSATNVTVSDEIKLSKDPQIYLGLGYSIRPKQAKGLGFIFDLGLRFGNPSSDLKASGGGVTQSDINTQNAKVQDAIDKLKILPVLGLGVNYSF